MKRISLIGAATAAFGAALAGTGIKVVEADGVVAPRARSKMIYGNQMTKRARRQAYGLPHYGAKELAKRYEEVRNPRTGHVTIRRVA